MNNDFEDDHDIDEPQQAPKPSDHQYDVFSEGHETGTSWAAAADLYQLDALCSWYECMPAAQREEFLDNSVGPGAAPGARRLAELIGSEDGTRVQFKKFWREWAGQPLEALSTDFLQGFVEGAVAVANSRM